MSTKAGKYNLEIMQGSTFSLLFSYSDSDNVPIDLTGYTARLQARATSSSTSIVFELTTENGGISLGGVLGTINLDMSATTTALLAGVGVYDLELVTGTIVKRLLEGNYSISPEVTR